MKKIISGKVREVYEINPKELMIYTTDRISAFDVILESEIPRKGQYLNKLSNYWFRFTEDIVANHLVSDKLEDAPEAIKNNPEKYADRVVIVKNLKMLPYEIIVRGYMFGNMWKSYVAHGEFCGERISEKYMLAEKLKTPLITPSIKNSEGHDEYISMKAFKDLVGEKMAMQLCDISLRLYERCYNYAIDKGIIIADTKFEFGLDENGDITLADEIFTPDSSRFWDLASYTVGENPKSYDKQYVRDWLSDNKLDGVEPAPQLPIDVINTTSELYQKSWSQIIDN